MQNPDRFLGMTAPQVGWGGSADLLTSAEAVANLWHALLPVPEGEEVEEVSKRRLQGWAAQPCGGLTSALLVPLVPLPVRWLGFSCLT